MSDLMFKHLKHYRKTVALKIDEKFNPTKLVSNLRTGKSPNYSLHMGIAKVHPDDVYSRSLGRAHSILRMKSYPIKLQEIKICSTETLFIFKFLFEDEEFTLNLHHKISGNYHLGSISRQPKINDGPTPALVKAMKNYKEKYEKRN